MRTFVVVAFMFVAGCATMPSAEKNAMEKHYGFSVPTISSTQSPQDIKVTPFTWGMAIIAWETSEQRSPVMNLFGTSFRGGGVVLIGACGDIVSGRMIVDSSQIPPYTRKEAIGSYAETDEGRSHQLVFSGLGPGRYRIQIDDTFTDFVIGLRWSGGSAGPMPTFNPPPGPPSFAH